MARRTIKDLETQLAVAQARIAELESQLAGGTTPQPDDYKSQRAYVISVAQRARAFYGHHRVFQSIKHGTIGIMDMSGKCRWGAVAAMDAYLTAKGL